MSTILSVGERFTFKGKRCEVEKTNKNGFWYKVLNYDERGWMNWWFYKTTPSYNARQPQRNIRILITVSHRQYKRMKEQGRI